MATDVRVNKWLDLLDRAGWTGIQDAAAAVVTALATDGIGWEEGLVFVGVAVLAAIVKVVIGQRTGVDDTGSLIGQPVISPPPQGEPASAPPAPPTTKQPPPPAARPRE